ncbi:CDP-alcohol phosphatidyltransferase family protein [Maribacter hydrothermalis]|uniref:CDP-alcohol phosphatidyltransferase n=1 Tax=Maribacter hydrothermalis TaxID=1836467 RepID=A0A1B7ZCI4_9FLAO|nr:CDP-alcohol phosphatidyltransferase family protein [Maribacter hydrothermalis]APQ18615.1 CDP-alcohol phosphatidyltransferase [Maribacter hydrothermalis]OBR40829.1 CDP-alcohol phosphatidyltransferase [Maribacter hydrothermalis]
MSKLPLEHRFLDLSDYGRYFGKSIANSLKETSFTPIDVTIWFIISGLLAIVFILLELYWGAAFFLIFKSILDAADGELARVKKTPSHTGRYLDSIADIILNIFIFTALWYSSQASFISCFLGFLAIQLQGTLYNYYYVILRNNLNGDTTSRVFEIDCPIAMKGEKQKNVNLLFRIYKVLYGVFDKTIYRLDPTAAKSKRFPKLLMTGVSTFGLGFQLFVISAMLVLGFKEFIFSFFLWYSILIFVFIGIRKLL